MAFEILHENVPVSTKISLEKVFQVPNWKFWSTPEKRDKRDTPHSSQQTFTWKNLTQKSLLAYPLHPNREPKPLTN